MDSHFDCITFLFTSRSSVLLLVLFTVFCLFALSLLNFISFFKFYHETSEFKTLYVFDLHLSLLFLLFSHCANIIILCYFYVYYLYLYCVVTVIINCVDFIFTYLLQLSRIRTIIQLLTLMVSVVNTNGIKKYGFKKRLKNNKSDTEHTKKLANALHFDLLHKYKKNYITKKKE